MVTFQPVFKLWMHSNYAVTTDHDDTGMQRRLKIAPFNTKPSHTDPHFKETLQRDPDALSALLNWMYAGFRAWFSDGYNLASITIDQATGHYWQSQDVYGRFAEDVLQFDPAEQIPSARLKQLFENWAEEEGVKLGREATMRDLQAYLTNRGCHPDKGRLAVSGRDHGFVCQNDCGLVNGQYHDRRTAVGCAPYGGEQAEPACGSHSPQ